MAFGTLMGAAYGAMAEIAPFSTTGGGLPFGLALWLGADEIAVPLLHLCQAAGSGRAGRAGIHVRGALRVWRGDGSGPPAVRHWILY